MNDRELLELAGKAAGMLVLENGRAWPDAKIGWFFNQVGSNPPALYDRAHAGAKWAPLTDDADAFRLAVALDIRYKVEANRIVVTGDDRLREPFALHRGDKFAATRRAIVRAAAEIARATPPKNEG